jgi:hypothetical protein
MNRTRRRFSLPEDGILDPVAIDLAARGARPVALTPAERAAAAARILARGGTAHHIARQLHVSGTTALTLASRARPAARGAR